MEVTALTMRMHRKTTEIKNAKYCVLSVAVCILLSSNVIRKLGIRYRTSAQFFTLYSFFQIERDC